MHVILLSRKLIIFISNFQLMPCSVLLLQCHVNGTWPLRYCHTSCMVDLVKDLCNAQLHNLANTLLSIVYINCLSCMFNDNCPKCRSPLMHGRSELKVPCTLTYAQNLSLSLSLSDNKGIKILITYHHILMSRTHRGTEGIKVMNLLLTAAHYCT